MIRLSILIPTLPTRRHHLGNIIYELTHSGHGYEPSYQIKIDDRAGIPTGTKRNWLMGQAEGEYVVFVDDDDHVAFDYIKQIIHATEGRPDCVTFRGHMTTNGAHRVNFVLRLGERYEERGGMYYRWPNHITPIKRSIAEQVKFPDVYSGEDYQWSKQINDRGLIKTEHFIDKEMYHYDFRTKK